MEHKASAGVGMAAGIDARREARYGARASSIYRVECFDRDGNLKWVEEVHNLVVNEGLDDVLNKHLKGSSYTAAWFVGLIDNADFGAIAATDTAAKITASTPDSPTTNDWAELSEYDESVRQTLTLGSVSGQSVSNAASKAVFTMSATKTVNGAFVISNSTKDGTSGILYGAASFSSPRGVEDDDTLNVTVTLTQEAA